MNGSETRPLIGVTTYFQEAQWGVWGGEAAILPGSYLSAFVDAGTSPVLLPPRGTEPRAVEALNGLVLIGGADVAPSTYGATPHRATESDKARDDHELLLLRAAEEAGIPILCICRGAQLLNAARGGTLHQHLPEVLPDGGRYRGEPGVFTDTEIAIEPGSRAHAILGDRCVVASYHHQGIDRVGRGLRVTARSADGLPQILEGQDDEWLVATQYHPEERRTDDARLFRAFAEACRNHAQRPSDHSRPPQEDVR